MREKKKKEIMLIYAHVMDLNYIRKKIYNYPYVDNVACSSHFHGTWYNMKWHNCTSYVRGHRVKSGVCI